jgi:hypothetical protein
VNGFLAENKTVFRLRRSGAGAQPLLTAKESADARDQDRQFERLRQIIIGSGREAFKDVFRAAARGQHERGNEVAGLAQLGNHRKTVLAGQHHIQDYDVEEGLLSGRRGAAGIGQQQPQRGFSGFDCLHLVTFGFEIEAQAVGQVLLVFDDEDFLA